MEGGKERPLERIQIGRWSCSPIRPKPMKPYDASLEGEELHDRDCEKEVVRGWWRWVPDKQGRSDESRTALIRVMASTLWKLMFKDEVGT